MAVREEEGTGEVQSKIKFWEVVRFVQTSEPVDEDFLERLQREGLSPSINEELVSVLLQADAKQSGWFNRFTSVLREHPKYRSSSVQLQDIDGETPRFCSITVFSCRIALDQVGPTASIPRACSTIIYIIFINMMAVHYQVHRLFLQLTSFFVNYYYLLQYHYCFLSHAPCIR